MRINTCEYNHVKSFNKTEEYCSDGFKFLTNKEYGNNHFNPNATKNCMKFIRKLRDNGYIVQVAEAFSIDNIAFSNPQFQHLAIYIKREDGKEVNLSEVWRILNL